MTVEQLIGDLLLRHNCVIIPSFGGFVAKPVSAKIDYAKGTMQPPGKSLLFNRQLINNDGLLINEFALKNAVTFDAAAKEVKDKVVDWNTRLKTGGRIEIDRVGNLFYDDEKNICFEQDRFFNLLLESFGLGTVHFLSEEDVQIAEKKIEPVEQPIRVVEEPAEEFKQEVKVIPIARTVITQDVEEQSKEVEPIEHPELKRRRRPWRYAAAACLLPIAFYSLWIPLKTDVLESGMISIHDFNPFHSSSDGSYVQEAMEKNLSFPEEKRSSLKEELDGWNGSSEYYTYKLDDETFIKVNVPKEEVQTEENPVEPDPVQETQQSFEPNTMYYIVGCFGDKSNADNLVAKLKANGLEGHIVDMHNGLHRVAAGGAVSMEAYYEIKAKADALGLSGWKLN